MPTIRCLTKSRFQLALECPAKLFYTGKADYANQSLEDSFLQALADGGFQVGELAKQYFPGGHQIDALDYETALNQTTELLQQENVTIYEAAIATGTLFIRADILVKNGQHFHLYEVKAKSFNPDDVPLFLTNKGTISSDWKPYLYDVAFQKHVLTLAFPGFTIDAHLMMADKSARCPTDGLNQKFRLVTGSDGRRKVSVSPALNDADLAPPILRAVNVDAECNLIYQTNIDGLSFSDRVRQFADHYASNTKIPTPISTACSDCEFRTSEEDEKKSGQRECWKEQLGWQDDDFDSPTVLDIWNFRRKSQLIDSNRIKLQEVTEADIDPKPDDKPGLSASQRQWLQIEKSQNNDKSIWLDRDNLQWEMDSWVFPLHMIDFETTMVAIPFNAGRHPYEGIAFQFSHHVVNEDGSIEHRGEYINTERGTFPNYDFIRNLKEQLSQDEGSIFRYTGHENTYLNMIYQQLRNDDSNIPDHDELCQFIQSITQSTQHSAEQWMGERNMIDLWYLVKRYYYDPVTNGSNSIKDVLPAILNSSQFLTEKYSEPIYGAAGGIKSLNFRDWQWIKFDSGKVMDPYKLLPRMFQDISEHDQQILSDDDELRNGGAALMAYARMQFEEMSDYEREEIRKALLKYCELDTMAMVMIYEGWKALLK